MGRYSIRVFLQVLNLILLFMSRQKPLHGHPSSFPASLPRAFGTSEQIWFRKWRETNGIILFPNFMLFFPFHIWIFSVDNDKGQKIGTLLGWRLLYLILLRCALSPQVTHHQSKYNSSSLMFFSRSTNLLIFNSQMLFEQTRISWRTGENFAKHGIGLVWVLGFGQLSSVNEDSSTLWYFKKRGLQVMPIKTQAMPTWSIREEKQ